MITKKGFKKGSYTYKNVAAQCKSQRFKKVIRNAVYINFRRQV